MAGSVTAQENQASFLPLGGQPLDLETTLFSGQVFRWRKRESWYEGVVFGQIVRVREVEGGMAFETAEDDVDLTASRLRDYFSLDVDLAEVYSALSRDRGLREALDRYRGMRVLRQDPWETTLFVPVRPELERVGGSRGTLRICAGHLAGPCHSEGIRATPIRRRKRSPEQGRGRCENLDSGYRARYIVAAAERVARGEIDLLALRETSYDGALNALMALDGIGDKVANCIMLFCMDKPQAFPRGYPYHAGIA